MKFPLSTIGATLDGIYYVTVSVPAGKRGAQRLDYVKRDLKTKDEAERQSRLHDTGIIRSAIAGWHTATSRHEMHTYTFAKNKDSCRRALGEVDQHLKLLQAQSHVQSLPAIADLLESIQDWVTLYAEQRVGFKYISDTEDLLDLLTRYRSAWLAEVKAA